jgi:heme A synthase
MNRGIVTSTSGYRSHVFAWAVLTATATVPLMVLGALVTSMRVGMVDEVPIREPWYMLLVNWQKLSEERGIGYLIEHTHRLAGWVVGLLTIILMVLLLIADRRRWMKLLGVIALLAVTIQGVFGIFRVALESAGLGLELAMLHGTLGPMTFAFLVAIAVMTSRSWWASERFEVEEGTRFRRVSRLTVLMVVLQLITGVWLRQIGQDQGYFPLFMHLFFALAVAAHVLMLWVRVGRWRPPPLVVNRPVQASLVLLGIQVLLGMAAWVYGGGLGARNQALVEIKNELLAVATSHVAVGALLLATCVVVMLRAFHHLAVSPVRSEALAIGAAAPGGGA